MLTPGRESHGVHVCHKCGWPFPNPHPSAKLRRAHKRVCGTVEGYKLVDSEDLNISDDDHLSDEDRTTPSPELIDKSNNEKHHSGISERSTRSEDEVFSDAVTEFPDSGLSPEVQEHLEDAKVDAANVGKISEKDLTVFYSFNGAAVADIIQPPSNSTDNIKRKNPEVPEDTTTLSDASQEIKMINASDDVTEGSMAYVGLAADAMGNGEINSDRDVMLSPGEYTGKTFEAEPKTQEKEEITSNPVSSDGVVLLKEELGDEMASNMSLSDAITGVESFENLNSTDVAQVKVGTEQGIDLAGLVSSSGILSGRGAVKENVLLLSVHSDIQVVDNAEIMLQDFKDYKGLKLLQNVTSDSCEIIKDKKDNVEDPLSMDNLTSFRSVQLNEATKVPASEMTVLEDNLLHEGSVPIVKKLSSEAKSDDHQIWNEVNPMTASMNNAMSPHDSGHHEKAIAEMYDVVGKGKNERLTDETLESAIDIPEFPVNQATNLYESDDASDHEQAKVEMCDVVGVESREEPVQGKLSFQKDTDFESDCSFHESQVAANDVMIVPETKLPETEFTNLDKVPTTQDVIKQIEISGNVKTKGECVAEHGKNVEILDRNSEDRAMKDPLISPLDTESSVQSSVTVDDNHARELGGEDSGIQHSLQVESDDNNFVKHQVGASVIDVSVDSLSQTDSLEANWGSISVLSTQSDTPAVVDAETLPLTDFPASMETEKTKLHKPEVLTKRQHSEKSDIFEAPSFMTLVEPEGGGHLKASASAIQTVQNPQQQKAPSSQAGWFPSLTNVVNESQGRKKNEEIIAKVTNWSTGKQHTPLKNLLGEANLQTKPKSPNMRGNKTPVIQQDETMTKDNGALATTVSSILSSEVPTTEPAKRGKEQNSPTRYLADIKREKRKVKGRPYWVQFVCCSSVN